MTEPFCPYCCGDHRMRRTVVRHGVEVEEKYGYVPCIAAIDPRARTFRCHKRREPTPGGITLNWDWSFAHLERPLDGQ